LSSVSTVPSDQARARGIMQDVLRNRLSSARRAAQGDKAGQGIGRERAAARVALTMCARREGDHEQSKDSRADTYKARLH